MKMTQIARVADANPRQVSARKARRGFTVIELMVVIGVIMALIATFTATGYAYYKKQARLGNAKLTLAALASAIDGYTNAYWAVNAYSTDPAKPPRNLRIWDLPKDPSTPLGKDGEIDGIYYLDGATWKRHDVVYPGYSGFLNMTGMPYKQADVENIDHDGNGSTPPIPNGRLVDPWGKPYRIQIYDPADTATWGSPPKNPFGSRWYGLTSSGPDTTPNTPDDIKGWEMASGG